MDNRTALAVLDDALQSCRKEDVRTPEVYAALEFLEARAIRKWPFNHFREALDTPGAEGWEAEGKWQILNASLNGIKPALTPGTAERTNPTRARREWVFEPGPNRPNKKT